MSLGRNHPYNYRYEEDAAYGEEELRRLADARVLDVDDIHELPAAAMRVRAGGVDSPSLRTLCRLRPSQIEPARELLTVALDELEIGPPSPSEAVVRLAHAASQRFGRGEDSLQTTAFEVQRLCDLSAGFLPARLAEVAEAVRAYLASYIEGSVDELEALVTALTSLAGDATSSEPDESAARTSAIHLADLSALDLIRPTDLPRQAEAVLLAGNESAALRALSELTEPEIFLPITLLERSLKECGIPTPGPRDAARRLGRTLAEEFADGLWSRLGFAQQIDILTDPLLGTEQGLGSAFEAICHALLEWDDRPDLREQLEGLIDRGAGELLQPDP